MKPLDEKATAIFRRLTEGLTKLGDHRKLDNAPGFMPVSVELVSRVPWGTIFAVAHYYEQCGDLMADPDMMFLVSKDGVCPMTYQQDNMGIYHEAVSVEGGELHVNTTRQAELVEFANLWMRNIEEQQFGG